jgi:hypothetical protein
MELPGSGCGPVLGFCEHGNELLSFVKDWAFLDELIRYRFLKSDSTL